MDRKLRILKRDAHSLQTAEAWARYARELERTQGHVFPNIPMIGVSVGFKRSATANKFLKKIQKKIDPNASIVFDVTIECEFVGVLQGGEGSDYLTLSRIEVEYPHKETEIRIPWKRISSYGAGIDPEDYLYPDPEDPNLETNPFYY